MSYELILKDASQMVALSSHIHDHFESTDKPIKVTITEYRGIGKWGMQRLWRSWMAVVADFMAENGATMPLMINQKGETYGKRRFNAQDAHELFTSQFLGLNEKGERLSWRKSEGENVADKGQRFLAMLKLQAWCVEKGINLPMPRDSEFNDLNENQNR